MKIYRIRPKNAKQDFLSKNLDVTLLEITLLIESGCEKFIFECLDLDEDKWLKLQEFNGYEPI